MQVMTDARTKETSVQPQTQTAPLPPPATLEWIVAAICLDASKNSRQYVLRSNTGHDGE
ncbi:hypothetical protein Pla52o_08890 [Novipirellula galeiformis]|uniref:Uncharacterized protein n=2 Tax=Novipirellula galeiformis TaxID=2528004 RepID=A0A5C6CRD2_9BACT|nr:hypothetical protein Pla52o_08890 [Novipirellula galeiformis]